MSTTRLFDQDAYLGEFEAIVERSVCEGGMYRVLLDQTAFFPEGGGQPADEGTLDGIFVTDVQEIDGEIWHTVEAPLEPGKTVVGKLDFEKRFPICRITAESISCQVSCIGFTVSTTLDSIWEVMSLPLILTAF